jgi:hypothetical protein
MSLPRFLDRVIDAAAPALGGLDRGAVRARLEDTSVALVAGTGSLDSATETGFLLAANLAARLYPSVYLEGAPELVARARNEIVLVNPACDISEEAAHVSATLLYGGATGSSEENIVRAAASGWNVYVDEQPDVEAPAATAAGALAAAVTGVSELFRIVFAGELAERGRRGPQPGAFNLVTLGDPTFELAQPINFELGEFALVGAGAIGQAAAHTLAASGARGTMVAVDHEKVALSNLQRYVLTHDSDVAAVKVELLRARLAGSAIEVVPVCSEWHAELADRKRSTMVALDSPEARIAVQASLPGEIYNAWTQPADVGWSRHERFGVDPCLACLYWPDRPRPSSYQMIAEAFRQHPLRVLGYLARRLPAGLPLPPDVGGAALPDPPTTPEDLARWTQVPIIADIAAGAGVELSALDGWGERPLADLYQEGICGGALLHLNVGVAPHEVLVPLAHQSVLAGVMLAVQLIVGSCPELRAARAFGTEGRYDVLAGLPQHLQRPRQRTDGCLCGDPVFQAVYRKSLGQQRPDSDMGAASRGTGDG